MEPVSGRHFVNNEDVFAIFKFLQMFFHPDPNPKKQGEGETKTHRAVFTFVCQPSDGRTNGRAIRRELGNNSWERG